MGTAHHAKERLALLGFLWMKPSTTSTILHIAYHIDTSSICLCDIDHMILILDTVHQNFKIKGRLGLEITVYHIQLSKH